MDRLSLILVIIGAINWGLIALFQFDLVASLFGGQDAFLSRIVYGLVGLAGLYCITLLFRERENPQSSTGYNSNTLVCKTKETKTRFSDEIRVFVLTVYIHLL